MAQIVCAATHRLVRIGDDSVRVIEKEERESGEGDEEVDLEGNGFDYQSGYEYQPIERWIAEFRCRVSRVGSDGGDDSAIGFGGYD